MSFTISIIDVKLRRDVIAQFIDKGSDVVIHVWNDNWSVLLVFNFPENNPIIMKFHDQRVLSSKVR